MKILLCTFEQLSTLKTNFPRVTYLIMGKQRTPGTSTRATLVVVGQLPFRYLGISMNHKNSITKIRKLLKAVFKKKKLSN
jgi:hypothetical protein